jgi:hypothetical protein
MEPTKTKYDQAFTVLIHHAYNYEWEQVPEDYQRSETDVMGTNTSGKLARRVHNNASKLSMTEFHPYAIQQIHDDRHAVRVARQEHIDSCVGICPDPGMHAQFPAKSDLAIIGYQIENGVIPHLTDTTSIEYFECPTYPEVGQFLNMMYDKKEPAHERTV